MEGRIGCRVGWGQGQVLRAEVIAPNLSNFPSRAIGNGSVRCRSIAKKLS